MTNGLPQKGVFRLCRRSGLQADNRSVKEKPSYWINSVDHALALAVLLHVEGPMSVTHAAQRIDVATSTAHRLLSMLVYRDFAIQDEHRVYHAGPMLSLGPIEMENTTQLREMAHPHLQNLAAATGESAFLMILTGAHSRFLASAVGSTAASIGNRDGMIVPAHRTSAGLAMLAQLTATQLEKLYSPARLAHLQGQLPSAAMLSAQLQQIRDRGYAIAAESAEANVTAVGCAVHWAGSQLHFGISVAAPASRFPELDLNDILRHLHRAARAIEKDLAKPARRFAS